MPHEVQCHTVPHLKALTRGIEHKGGHGRASIFSWQKISLKSTHCTSYTDTLCTTEILNDRKMRPLQIDF